ncbi:hypothetical protein NUITMVRA1_12900 [Aerococcus viridans]|nr:hypothetical protein NUITMVRA1_12900 [Aerococcus viridans]
MRIFQVLYGYLLLFSITYVIFSLFNSSSLILIVFITEFIIFKITPHPHSHLNPFAFGLNSRF